MKYFNSKVYKDKPTYTTKNKTMSLACLSSVKRSDDNKRPVAPSSHTDISIVFDRSQSMQWMMSRACDGLLQYIGDMKEQNLKNRTAMRITLIPFDTRRGEAIYDADDINTVRNLESTHAPFIAQGMTCLYDTAISVLEEQKSRCGEDEHDWKKIYVVITDGADNQSIHTCDEYKEAVEAARADGTTAIFMGANQDGVRSGERYGFSRTHAVTFTGGAANAAMGECLSSVTQAAYSGHDVGFTQLQREVSAGSQDATIPMGAMSPPLYSPPLRPASNYNTPRGDYPATLASNLVLPHPLFVRTDTVSTQASSEGSS